MLPKENRLAKREDFAAVYAKGLFGAYGEISIKYLKTGNNFTRIGFPIGKNFSKKAVERNRARRILREAASFHLKSLKTGFDIVVMIKPGKNEMDQKSAASGLEKVFRKNNLFAK